MAAFQEKDALRRRQARVVLASFIALAASGALLVATTFHWVTVSLPIAVYLVPLWICGGLLAYAMLELNLFDLGGVVRRGLTAGILATGAVGVYLALYLGLRSIVDATTAWASPDWRRRCSRPSCSASPPSVAPWSAWSSARFFPGQREGARPHPRRERRARPVARRRRSRPPAAGAVASGFAASSMRLVSGPREGPVEEVGAPPGAAPLVLPPGDPLATILGRGACVRFAGTAQLDAPAARGQSSGPVSLA
jgi:hypothetical protein